MRNNEPPGVFLTLLSAILLFAAFNTLAACPLFAGNDDEEDQTEDTAAGWSNTYGWGETYTEYHAYGLAAAGEGFFFAAQNVRNGAGSYDFWAVRLDASGGIVWERGFGGPNAEEPFVARSTDDGGFIVAGQSYSFRTGSSNCDAWVVKLSSAGAIEWQRSYGGTGIDSFLDLREVFDAEGDSAGFLLCGYTTSFGAGGRDVWVVGIDGNGAVLRQRAYGGTGDEYGRSLALTDDGGCVLAADTTSFGAGNRDALLFKIDADGDVVWGTAYGGAGVEFPRSLAAAAGGGFVVGAYTDSFGAGEEDFWAFKADADGDLVWQYTYGGPYADIAHDLIAAGDGSFALVGWTYPAALEDNDAWVLRIDGSGQILRQKRYNIRYDDADGERDGNDWAYRIIPTADGGCAVSGDSDDLVERNGDVWVFRIDPAGSLGCGMETATSAVGNGAASVETENAAAGIVATATAATVAATSAAAYQANPEVIAQCP